MEKGTNRKKILKALILILMVPSLLFLLKEVTDYQKLRQGLIDQETFRSEADVSVREDWVGANVWLKQAVHGTNGIKYRYVVETDCPSWNFETRYVSDKPLDWVDSKTSAVEVMIYDTQIRYNGTVYADGQYYTVPLLGGLSSENVPLETWTENLVSQAYQTYVAEINDSVRKLYLPASLVLGLSAAWVICTTKKKAKETGSEN